MGISATDNENNIEVFSTPLCSVIWNKMQSTCGSKKLNALANKSCPNAKRAIETTNVQMYIVLEGFNMLALTLRRLGWYGYCELSLVLFSVYAIRFSATVL